jgi:mono/diheme cytochrome c family protein
MCLLVSGFVAVRAQDNPTPSECTYFGSDRDKLSEAAAKATGHGRLHPLSDLTSRITEQLAYVPPGSPTYGFDQSHPNGSIDSYIFADLQTHGIAPAPATTDWEFIRRVTLDLTGRIPTPSAVLSFVNDTASNKRAKLIDQLLASPQWVDKWTMFYGDLFQNTVTRPSTGLNRFPQGRNAFYQYIHDSLASGKPYAQMANEMIGATADNSYNSGPANFLVGSFVANGPAQDTFDAQTASVADIFLGVTYVNCVLCHNGRGHLDQINLWGSNITRYQAWQLAAYMSHTQAARTPVTAGNNNIYYWSLQNNTKGYTLDYPLNTTSGNRPPRTAPSGCKSGQPCFYVQPQYIFNGNSPAAGQDYRASLAAQVTGDFQFARAAVNYVWAHFFGMGIVDPPDTFDLARLDPNNPPPAPWTLQPTNANLLNALATHFIQNNYDLRALMREIANSQAYQLSSRYNGKWNVAWEPYFARKYVRRLWAEEIVDGILQSSGYMPGFTVTNFTDQGFSKPIYTMQLPDSIGVPDDGNTRLMLDTFLRGNRDDQPRRSDGSILQALNLMNGPVVQGRLAYTGSTPSPLIAQNLPLGNQDLVNTLFLTILSRYPTSDEMSKAVASLNGATGSSSARSQAVQDLVWSLYNKVDFLFNY